MDKQLPVIQQDVLYAERRIAEFRSQHPLLATKSGSLTEAQLYGVNTALVQARAALGGKRAKLDIIRTIQSTGGDLDTMTDVIESPLISALRREEAELAAKNAQLATTLDRSEEHTSELQSLMRITYAVICLKQKPTQHTTEYTH